MSPFNNTVIPIPSADMGFPGFVQFETNDRQSSRSRFRSQVRAISCGLKLEQGIESLKQGKSPGFPYSYPYMDKMVHIVKPETIGGSIEYPVSICEGSDSDITVDLWNLAVERSYQERLYPFNTYIKYSEPEQAFKYEDCLINSFTISCAQQDIMKINIDIWAKNRKKESFEGKKIPSNSRVANWSDAFCNLKGSFGTIDGRWLRSFTATVNNNLQRFYTSGANLLRVKDITPQLRDITGNVIIMGRHPDLSSYARNNPVRCSSDSLIEIGYKSGSKDFEFIIPNVIFNIEELSLSNDLFETSVNWVSIPADQSMYSF